jgi:hypothetical protein
MLLQKNLLYTDNFIKLQFFYVDMVQYWKLEI